MPARKLESYVQKGIKAGFGIEPSTLAETLYTVASRGERVPLRLPLGHTCWEMAKSKFESLLEEFEAVQELSAIGPNI